MTSHHTAASLHTLKLLPITGLTPSLCPSSSVSRPSPPHPPHPLLPRPPQKNHLSGLQRKLLKVSFYNVQQLMEVRRDITPTVNRTSKRSTMADAVAALAQQEAGGGGNGGRPRVSTVVDGWDNGLFEHGGGLDQHSQTPVLATWPNGGSCLFVVACGTAWRVVLCCAVLTVLTLTAVVSHVQTSHTHMTHPTGCAGVH